MEQNEQINTVESTLRDYVGHQITPELTFNGFNTIKTHEGSRIQLFVSVPGLDGDDSHEAFQDNDGVDETVDFLERIGLMTPEYMKLYTF